MSRAAFSRWPWPLAVLCVFLASRAVSTAVLLGVAATQPASPWGAAHPGYLDFLGFWDSEWYRRVFEHGYPDVVPRTGTGAARENTWAFLPLFPMLVRAVSPFFGGQWMPTAAVLAPVCGLFAAAALYLLFRPLLGHGRALWAMALVLFSPLGALFQVPYAEPLHLGLVALTLLCLGQRRFAAAIPLIVLSALARPTAAPLALTVLVLCGYWMTGERKRGLAPGDVVALLGCAVAALIAGVAWPVIAWIRTGEPSAYTDTETVWRGGSLDLFSPWLDRAEAMFGPGPLAWAALGLVVLLFAALLVSRPLRAAGVTLWSWCFAYVLYLAAVFDPQTSTFRLLLPLFPVAAVMAAGFRSGGLTALELTGPGAVKGRSRRRPAQTPGARKAELWAWLALGVVLQLAWVAWLWRWTPLPGGGDYPP
ncbi:hypothetical protein [Arthrobacter sp. UM1]|uniref:hypothetical protein n=1 Tax=Arthrobacter sp. UM1 TaxID=2766776 RepID=UPI001CF609EB|nr:hypothetical protein [Arthrobacter sp. UM1]MCB4208152.1 hypothetical protein [Arthrobacter sp. UM1]